MDQLSVEQLLQLLDHQKLFQYKRATDLDDLQKSGIINYHNAISNNVNGYCTSSYNSGNSSTSSLRSSPTSSMLSSGPTSPSHAPSIQTSLTTIRKKNVNSKQSRAAHNELEKNRRANLRSYLDQIKDILPPEYDSSRDTTLSLLTRARNHIKQWKNKRAQSIIRKEEAIERNQKLKEKIEKAKTLRNVKKCRQMEQENHDNIRNITNLPQDPPSIITKSPVKPDLTNLNLYSTPIDSPVLESNKNRMVSIDPYLEGLLPAVPLSYPYPYVQQTYNHQAVV